MRQDKAASLTTKRPPFPISSLKGLKVAGIMDPFTATCFAPECQLLELTSQNWKQEIGKFQPHLLFLESAWHGKSKSWIGLPRKNAPTLIELTKWCRKRKIPILYWGKEDPVDILTFMPVAKLADVVFTTELDCIPTYRQHLQHNRIYFCHFAAQPLYHNPIEKYLRKDKFCFAGSYYIKFPERCHLFEQIVQTCDAFKGVDIFDRNYGKNISCFLFPEQYQEMIRGTLSPQEIDKAYKGYSFGINMNSVTDSSTMFARRVFETLASNTVIVSNHSIGLENIYGDLTLAPLNITSLIEKLKQYCGDDVSYRKYRLLGLRKTLRENLYEDRLAFMASKIFSDVPMPSLPRAVIFTSCSRKEDLDRLVILFKAQSHRDSMLYVTGNFEQGGLPINVRILSAEDTQKRLTDFVSDTDVVGVWSPNHYYGPNYLTDLLLTLRYHDVRGMGKANWYSQHSENIQLNGTKKTYRNVDNLLVDRSLFVAYLFPPSVTPAVLLNERSIASEGLFGVDEFHFCENCRDMFCPTVDDIQVTNIGKSQNELYLQAKKMKCGPMPPSLYQITSKRYLCLFKIEKTNFSKKITLLGIPLYFRIQEGASRRCSILNIPLYSRKIQNDKVVYRFICIRWSKRQ